MPAGRRSGQEVDQDIKVSPQAARESGTALQCIAEGGGVHPSCRPAAPGPVRGAERSARPRISETQSMPSLPSSATSSCARRSIGVVSATGTAARRRFSAAARRLIHVRRTWDLRQELRGRASQPPAAIVVPSAMTTSYDHRAGSICVVPFQMLSVPGAFVPRSPASALHACGRVSKRGGHTRCFRSPTTRSVVSTT